MHMRHIQIHFARRFPSENRGISLLIVVVILGTALLIMSLSALIIGFGEREGGDALQGAGETLAVADGCMNEVFLRLSRDASYGSGGGAIPFTAPNGSCSITVQDTGGGSRQIDVTATSASFVKHIRSSVVIAGAGVTLTSWEERGD